MIYRIFTYLFFILTVSFGIGAILSVNDLISFNVVIILIFLNIILYTSFVIYELVTLIHRSNSVKNEANLKFRSRIKYPYDRMVTFFSSCFFYSVLLAVSFGIVLIVFIYISGFFIKTYGPDFFDILTTSCKVGNSNEYNSSFKDISQANSRLYEIEKQLFLERNERKYVDKINEEYTVEITFDDAYSRYMALSYRGGSPMTRFYYLIKLYNHKYPRYNPLNGGTTYFDNILFKDTDDGNFYHVIGATNKIEGIKGQVYKFDVNQKNSIVKLVIKEQDKHKTYVFYPAESGYYDDCNGELSGLINEKVKISQGPDSNVYIKTDYAVYKLIPFGSNEGYSCERIMQY